MPAELSKLLCKADPDTFFTEMGTTFQAHAQKMFRHRYELAEDVSLDHFLREAATGDILLRHGTTRNSKVLQRGMPCYFSHVAMLVVDPPADVLGAYGLEAPARDPNKIYVWESSGERVPPRYAKAGTRMLPWGRWVRLERRRHGPEYFLAWRRFRGLEPERKAALHAAVGSLAGTPYEKDRFTMILAWAGGLNRRENVESVFCSEVVAYALKRAGLLEQQRLASNCTTAHFSFFYGGDRLVDHHLTHGDLRPEAHVVLPDDIGDPNAAEEA